MGMISARGSTTHPTSSAAKGRHLHGLVGAVRKPLSRVKANLMRLRARLLAPVMYRRIARSGMHPVLVRQLHMHLANQPLGRLMGLSLSDQPSSFTDVLYVTNVLAIDAIKDVINLQRHGGFRCTVYYSKDWENRELAERDNIELVKYQDYWDLAMLLSQTRSTVTVARRGSPQETAIVALFSTGRLIYKPYDFVHRYNKEYTQERLRTTPESHYAEDYVMRRSDGLIHYHDDAAIQYLKETYGYDTPALQVRPGCMDDFRSMPELPKLSDRDGEIHIAFAAGLARRSSDTKIMGESDHYDEFVKLLDQGLHLHVYIAYQTQKDRESDLKHYFDLADKYPRYFHPEKTLPYSQLVRDLTKYDYGYAYLVRRPWSQREPVFYSSVSNNFYTYLDAGLPVLLAETYWAQADLVNQYQMGLVLKPEELGRLGEMLRATNREKLVANIEAARPNLLYESDKFISFVKDLCQQGGRNYQPNAGSLAGL